MRDTKFPYLLERHQLPNESEALKDLILQMAQSYQETLTYLQSEILLLKRFRYGQSSERKKKA